MHHRFGRNWRSGALVVALLLVLPTLVRAATPGGGASNLRGSFSFGSDELSWGSFQGYDMPMLKGAIPSGMSGHPELPERSEYFTIPDGYRVVEVRVDHVERRVERTHRRIAPVRIKGTDGEVCWESPSVYGRSAEYPGRVVELANVGAFRGRRIAEILYHPVAWNPASGEVILYPRVDYTVVIAPELPGTRAPVAPLRESVESRQRTSRLVNAQVANAEIRLDGDDLSAGIAAYTPFRPTEYPSLDGSLVEYVIITTDGLASAWQSFADAKTQRGVPTLVRTTSWIEANYRGGTDLAENIRLFIRDAYQKWGTQYVLLGGDTGVIPTRYAYIHYYAMPQGEEIPTDLYYSCLDGSWDGDGDGVYGEGFDGVFMAAGDSVDFYPEVFVGRAPVKTALDVTTFRTKTLNYRLTPSGTTNWTTVGLLAEVLFPTPWSYGDPVFLNGCDIVQDIIDIMTPPWTTFKLCEYPDSNMTFNAVRNALNAGYGMVSLVTHGDAFKLSTSDGRYFRSADMAALTNANKCGVYFYSNCNTGQYDSDCLNEAALFNAGGGCVAAVAPSRLEFPHISRFYMEEYYRLIFRTDAEVLGEISEAHKLPFIGSTGSDNAYRWVHLAASLMGDPELHIWKSAPDSMTVTHAGSMTVSDTSYTVTVTKSGSPVSGAKVALWNGTTKDYARGFTDAGGVIVMNYRPSATGNVALTVTHPLYRTRSGTVTVGAGSGARLAVTDIIIDDDTAGLSSGNGDRVPDAGELIELGVKLRNAGSVSVTGVTGTLGLTPGSNLTIDLTQNGAAQPLRTFLGESGANPGALPAVLDLNGAAPSLWGRPIFNAAARPDTGAYVWRDLSGCHVRFAGGKRTMTFSGSIATDGTLLAVRPFHLEASDTWSAGATTLTFTANLDSMEWEDGFDFVVADSAYTTVLIAGVNYGTLAPGDTVTRYCLVQTEPEAPDRHSVRMPFTVTGTAGGAQTWAEGLRLELEAPVVGEEYHAIDDSTDGGNKNGTFETGETIRLNVFAHNDGHGTAPGVQGVLRPVSGVTVQDSIVSFGDIPATGLAAGATRFRLTGTGTPKVASLELTDAYGRSWTKQINLSVPGAPGTPIAQAVLPQVARAIDLQWAPPVAADIAGYNVYRANSGSSTFTRVNPMLIDQSAFYHDTSVLNESTYVYRVAAVDSAGNEGPRSAAVTATAPPPWLGTFPKTLSGTIWSSPVLADLGEDASGDLEIIVGCEDGLVYVFNPDGSTRTGWPKPTGGEIWASPAVGNIDGDPQLEIIVGSNSKQVYAWNFNGSGVISADGLFAAPGAEVRSSPVLADLDANGTLEIIFGTSGGKVLAFQGNHAPYGADSIFASPGGTITATVTVADLDGNGDLEVLVPNLNGKLYAYNHDKTPYNGSAIFHNGTSNMWASCAVGDADGDGQMDVFGATWGGQVYRWNKLGVVQAGWPKATGGAVWSSPALGDLNGDGKLECIVGSSDWTMHAYQWNGTELAGWPFTAEDSIWTSPVVADITGDARPDVVFGSMDSRLYAIKHDGTRVPGWPVVFTDRCFGSSAAIGDVDRDGRVDIVAGGYEGRIYGWSIGKPWNPSPAASPWPLFHHDAYRTGWYHRPLSGVEGGPPPVSLPVATGLGQNEPNPFNPRTTIRYDLASAGPVSLAVFDVSGRRVRTLVSGPQDAGRYSIIWDGSDDRGRDVASGVYFYRLESGAETFDRKMILMK